MRQALDNLYFMGVPEDIGNKEEGMRDEGLEPIDLVHDFLCLALGSCLQSQMNNHVE